MVPQTFTSFARLPQELRDMIWEFAVMLRPDPLVKPGAHFFTVVSTNVMGVHGFHQARRLSPPSRHASLSAYLIDGGLWTACRDSRRAMDKRYQPRLWRNLLYERRPDAPMTQCFDPRGQLRAFTTFPGADLICLQPLDLSVLGLQDQTLESLGLSGPSFRWACKHIAFEYDPLWQDNILDFLRAAASPTTLATATNRRIGAVRLLQVLQSEAGFRAKRIWLIDFGIRRIPVVDTVGDRAVFYGDGCRFTEVVCGDPGWVTDTYEAVDSFAEAIYPLVYRPNVLCPPDPIGILACEMLSK